MKFEVEMKQIFTVEFSDKDLAEKYFVGEDAPNAEAFFESDELSEVAEYLCHAFNNHSHFYQDGDWVKQIEGFANFVRGVRNRETYVSETNEYGKIIVTETQELEVDYTQTISN